MEINFNFFKVFYVFNFYSLGKVRKATIFALLKLLNLNSIKNLEPKGLLRFLKAYKVLQYKTKKQQCFLGTSNCFYENNHQKDITQKITKKLIKFCSTKLFS